MDRSALVWTSLNKFCGDFPAPVAELYSHTECTSHFVQIISAELFLD